jgi:hypothetical protein
MRPDREFSDRAEPWRFCKRRLGLAWQEPDDGGGWRKRRGRCREGWLDERAAHVATAAALEAFEREIADAQQAERAALERRVTVRAIAAEWLEWLAEVRGAKPSTIQDYGFLLRDPGAAHKRGSGVASGRIMRAFGDVRYDHVTTADVSSFLRELDREDLAMLVDVPRTRRRSGCSSTPVFA